MPLQTGIFSELLETQRVSRAGEQRSSLENPQTPLSFPAEWLLDIFNGGRTDAGVRVSELTAFQVITFLACVDLIAGSIASLPQHVYERVLLGNGRVAHHVAYDHGLYEMVHLQPNDEMSSFVFTKAYMAHILAWGNGYAELQRDGGNRVTAIWPRNPYKTRPYRVAAFTRLQPTPWRPFPVDLPPGTLVYKTTDSIDSLDTTDLDAESPSEGRLIPAEDMLHVPGLSFDGRIGQSTVWLARQTLGLALATEKFGAKYFANYARPGGFLEAPMLTPEQKEQAKRSWMEAQGGENSHKVAVMPPGFKFTALSNKPDESQVTETRRFLRTEIAAVFHVPPRMIGDDQVKGRASAEQDAQEFTQYSLMCWLNALKLEWKRKLFPSRGLGRTPTNRFYMDFDLADLLRPDAASREKFYASGRQWGYLNTNDVRGYEKLNPIQEPWAEQYWIPVNMTLTTTPINPNVQDGARNGDGEDATGASEDAPKKEAKAAQAQDEDDRAAQMYGRWFKDAFQRVCHREKRDLNAITGAFLPVLSSVRDFYFARAARPLEVAGMPGIETDDFLTEYLGAMQRRAAGWDGERSDVWEAELRRGCTALRMAAYREAASMKAKQGEQSQ